MIRIAHNAVHARLFDAPREAKLEVHRLLSYKVDGVEHMAAFQNSGWDGQSSYFSHAKDSFPAGFVRLVAQGLRKAGYEIQIVAKPLPEPLGPELPEVDPFGYTERYDYQPKAIDQLIRHGNIIVQVATGGGKSRIARMAMRRINRPTLFLTTRGILMHQMRKAIETMEGSSCAVLGDGAWGIPYRKPDGSEARRLTKFTVGMVQTLAQRLAVKTVGPEYEALRNRRATTAGKKIEAMRKKLAAAKTPPTEAREQMRLLIEKLDQELPTDAQDRAEAERKVAEHERLRLATVEILKRFELVIAEEAHEVSGDSFYNVMCALPNARYRMALTATPFMKDDQAANMNLLAACGPVAIQITEKLLIDRGILAKPYFKFVQLAEADKPKGLFRSTGWHRAYELGIVTNLARNKAICQELMLATRHGLNGMVLVQHKAHGELLLDMLGKVGLRAMFIYGEDNQDERQAALAALGDGSIDVLIGSTILDVGVDVPSIGIVVLAGGGKAEVSLRQRVGRGLREKKGHLPNIALIVDFADDFNTHLLTHARQRRAIIEATPSFVEGIVRDFDYRGLGLKPRAPEAIAA